MRTGSELEEIGYQYVPVVFPFLATIIDHVTRFLLDASEPFGHKALRGCQ